MNHADVGATGRLIRVLEHVLGRTHDLSVKVTRTNHATTDDAGHLPDAIGAPGDADIQPTRAPH
jgi:hypothetical protein